MENGLGFLYQALAVVLLGLALTLFLSGIAELNHLHEKAKTNVYEQHVISCEQRK